MGSETKLFRSTFLKSTTIEMIPESIVLVCSRCFSESYIYRREPLLLVIWIRELHLIQSDVVLTLRCLCRRKRKWTVLVWSLLTDSFGLLGLFETSYPKVSFYNVTTIVLAQFNIHPLSSQALTCWRVLKQHKPVSPGCSLLVDAFSSLSDQDLSCSWLDFCCPDVNRELFPPFRSQDSKQLWFCWVASSQWGSNKPIGRGRAEWTGWGVRFNHDLDVDWTWPIHSMVHKY